MRILEAEIGCPKCHTLYAQVFRVQRNEMVWDHEKVPADAPVICPLCQTVLERR